MDLKSLRAAEYKAAQEIAEFTKSRELTPEEEVQFDKHEAEIKSLDTRIARAEKASTMINTLGALGTPNEETPEAVKSGKPARTAGEHFVKTIGGLKAKNLRVGVVAESSEFGLKAATDVTTVGDNNWDSVDRSKVVHVPDDLGVAELFSQGSLGPDSNTLVYTVETLTEGAAAAVAEGAALPSIKVHTDQVREGLSKVGAKTEVSDEMYEDEAFVVSHIDGRLKSKVNVEEQRQLISGDGTGVNILGILNRSGLLIETAANVDDNDKAIYRATTAIEIATEGISADAILMHPLDYQRERLRQDNNGQYVGGGAFTGAYGNGGFTRRPPLWGITTITSTAIPQGVALVGAFKSAELVRKGQMAAAASHENNDNFDKGIVTLKGTKRLGLMVQQPYAFCKVALSSVAAA